MPGDYAGRFAFFDSPNHFVKYWASGRFCGTCFLKLLQNFYTFFLSEFRNFIELGLNREDLFVFCVGRLARIQEIFHLYTSLKLATASVKHWRKFHRSGSARRADSYKILSPR